MFQSWERSITIENCDIYSYLNVEKYTGGDFLQVFNKNVELLYNGKGVIWGVVKNYIKNFAIVAPNPLPKNQTSSILLIPKFSLWTFRNCPHCIPCRYMSTCLVVLPILMPHLYAWYFQCSSHWLVWISAPSRSAESMGDESDTPQPRCLDHGMCLSALGDFLILSFRFRRPSVLDPNCNISKTTLTKSHSFRLWKEILHEVEEEELKDIVLSSKLKALPDASARMKSSILSHIQNEDRLHPVLGVHSSTAPCFFSTFTLNRDDCSTRIKCGEFLEIAIQDEVLPTDASQFQSGSVFRFKCAISFEKDKGSGHTWLLCDSFLSTSTAY